MDWIKSRQCWKKVRACEVQASNASMDNRWGKKSKCRLNLKVCWHRGLSKLLYVALIVEACNPAAFSRILLVFDFQMQTTIHATIYFLNILIPNAAHVWLGTGFGKRRYWIIFILWMASPSDKKDALLGAKTRDILKIRLASMFGKAPVLQRASAGNILVCCVASLVDKLLVWLDKPKVHAKAGLGKCSVYQTC